MKKISAFLILFFVASSTFSINTFNDLTEETTGLTVSKIEGHDKIYQNGRFYICGQPSLEDIEWLKNEGITKIINLRSDSENEKFSLENFDEKTIVKENNIQYVSIPVASAADYNPEKLELFANELQASNGKILIHCASAGRVTFFLMAYFIKYENVSPKDAELFGKQIKYVNYIDLLLGN